MTDLTDDEFTVLMIAETGERLITIGRWEQPVRNLVSRKMLETSPWSGDPTGMANCVITDAGRAALRTKYASEDKALTDALVSANMDMMQSHAAPPGEEMAQKLAAMARASVVATDDTPVAAARRWSGVILARALELLAS